ncbi:inner membrane complex protein 1h, putative (IMC1h) [Plasmodium ovale wallikeri]|uniref:Inner membrane complex protein 1h, putative (IMC1h) n=1 Tax=Plasmodium ovale wallikeri TaxID=864142 RepID=A0A1A8ZXW9_PLAOA|nr:inner membrane complex protein 1h, putative (IMC1h) [Plasmodium ovale wallikeri]SBT49168.1 inner membrane complex protein 1h, putative (IMC1h) [Plasmodium ovale wallikeri]
MAHQNMLESTKVCEDNNGEINYDELANNMLEKMDKHIYDQTSLYHSNEEYVRNKNIVDNMIEEKGKQIYGMSSSSLLRNEPGNLFNKERGTDEHTVYGGSYPRRVMTALGPLPLPEEFKKNIPEKFVAKPIIEEREIYVSKKERKQREIEIPHVKYEHTFEKVNKLLKVNKLVPSVSEVIKQVPKEVLKPVIEEKIIEIPQGVKYIEVPVEVPCLYPPKIVPKVVTQYVERIVETIKPVVQEKIIEVPQTVIKQVPKIKTVEVPYYVPRYVEKVVEVPFKPNGEMPQLGAHIPFSISESFPPLKPTQFLSNTQNEHNQSAMGPYPSGQYPNEQYPNEQSTKVLCANRLFQNHCSILPQISCFNKLSEESGENTQEVVMQGLNMSPTVLKSLNPKMPTNNLHTIPGNMPIPSNTFIHSNVDSRKQHENLYTQIENLPHVHNLPDGLKWQYPDRAGINNSLVNNNNMPPLVFTCPPEIGKVTCTKKDIQPDILTKTGVYEFDGFKKKGTSQSLFPPLAHHDRVPFLPSPAAPGTPDIKNIEGNN